MLGINSLIFFEMAEKTIESIKKGIESGIINTNANPARFQGTHRPKTLNKNVNIASVHKMIEQKRLKIVKIFAAFFILCLLY